MRSTALHLALIGALFAGAATPAHAGWFDAIFGKSASKPDTPVQQPQQPDSKNREWQLHEFTSIKLVPREAGSEPNLHPVRVDPEALRGQLAAIQAVVDKSGNRGPLFDKGELDELVPILSKALLAATPADDVQLLSADRREGGFIGSPLALTARLFVDAAGLEIIVHDARQDFYDAYRGSYVQPRFVYGMRATPGSAVLSSAGAKSRRADWLTLPMNVASARGAVDQVVVPAPIGAAAPGGNLPVPIAPAVVAPAASPQPAPVAAVPAVAPVVAVPAAAPAAAAPMSDPERRLETLKRLHSKGLITDQEFEEKRREILKSL
ncbi:SHOCT domain-containing protein [Paucibacter sp. R3-3]|uniref:SHOCT domain-containing protein n=1 Tax=Roseateles agri TaxID=3098619 RepID=A0ABU5DQK0_9BURK|nr:SHOCT domain-containing protein [Paucibacter sp. R3-3]MDY0748595.1 SHOCT domain-containing protein [Paucibacter sp. R3-3]